MSNDTVFLTCGPSHLSPRVPRYLLDALKSGVASVSHRSPLFQEWYRSAAIGIRQLLSIPADFSVFFLSSSLESMERILQNTVVSKSYHVVNGAFSEKWYRMAAQLGKYPQALELPTGQGMTDKTTIHPPAGTELLCVTHNETSTGVTQSLKPAYAYKKRHPSCLLAVDVVSSLPFAELDYSLVDCVFCSVQKGFGLPAGLGILILSPQAIKKSAILVRKKVVVGSYHSFAQLAQKAEQFQTVETPNVLTIYLLSRVVADLLKKSITAIRTETLQKADGLYSAVQNISSTSVKPFVADPELRSPTTIVLECGASSQNIRDSLGKRGFAVSAGYGPYKKEHIRIANFPQHSPSQMRSFVRELRRICRSI